MAKILELRALLSIVILTGGGFLLWQDGPLVERAFSVIVGAFALVTGYWFGAASPMTPLADTPPPSPPPPAPSPAAAVPSIPSWAAASVPQEHPL